MDTPQETPQPQDQFPPQTSPPPPKQRRRLRWVAVCVVVAILVVVFAGALAIFRMLDGPDEPQLLSGADQSSSLVDTTQPEVPKTHLRFIATGDSIAHDSVNENAQTTTGYDYYQFTDNMQQVFDGADVRFCNQATLAAGEAFGVQGYPIFNAPTEWSRDMARLGCNVINTGTNHTNDISQTAITAAAEYWDTQDVLAVAGANASAEQRDSVQYFEQDGVRFAFVSYTAYTNAPGETAYGLTELSDELASAQLSEAEAQADVTIVSMRWGTEYATTTNAFQREWAERLSSLGADIILGHGPHVLQPVERVGDALVWYSLGNFMHTQLEAETRVNCVASMDINLQTFAVENVTCLPIYMHYDWTAEQAAAEDLLARQNLDLYLLEDAASQLASSHLNTTIDAQIARITESLGPLAPIVTYEDYLQ